MRTLSAAREIYKHGTARAVRAIVAVLMLTVLVPPSGAQADTYDTQIQALKSKNATTQQVIGGLTIDANNYQEALASIQDKIASIEAQIAANQAMQTDLEHQIATNKAKVKVQQGMLATDLKSMYIDSNMSTLEMLATSDNLSDYVDKTEYQTTVQDKLQALLASITALQAKLKQQQGQVVQLIKTEQAQQVSLTADQQKQDQLLALNQSQQATLTGQIQQNNAKIADLEHQQVLANQRLALSAVQYGGSSAGSSKSSGSGSTAYPWADAVCLNGGHTDADCYPANVGEANAYNWGYLPYNQWDSNGFQYRNCTSYAAFRVHQATGISLAGYGNAKDWVYNTPYRVDQNPSNSDVEAAVFTGGYYGHVMFVEHVNGDGTVLVSQYNYNGQGEYSTMTISVGSAEFIHF